MAVETAAVVDASLKIPTPNIFLKMIALHCLILEP